MIYIYKELVKNNISKLKISHLESFAIKNNLTYSDSELNIIYNFIMNNYNELLNGNELVIKGLKDNINSKLYNDLFNLYTEYKNKYL